MTASCILTHRAERPRRAAYGLLCGGHVAHLARLINAMPQLDDDLTAAHLRTQGQGEKVSGSPSRGLRLHEAVPEIRSQILHDMTWWARWVAGERGVTAPAHTVAVASVFLQRHGEWLTHRAEVADLFGALLHLERAASAVAYPSGVRRIPMGDCPEFTSCLLSNGRLKECCGTVWTTRFPDDYPEPPPLSARCDTCGMEWSALQWARLGRRIMQMREAS